MLDVVSERRRQIYEEGWSPEHDDEHTDGSLADAAAWDRRRDLVRAAALIVAEIERLDRALSVAGKS